MVKRVILISTNFPTLDKVLDFQEDNLLLFLWIMKWRSRDQGLIEVRGFPLLVPSLILDSIPWF